MGICASSSSSSGITRGGSGGANAMNWPHTAMVIDLDGGLQEFRQPIRANRVLSRNPNCFLCSSEALFVGSHTPQLPSEEELQLGQIYFVMPISKSQAPLSLQDLCALAIKASAGLNNSVIGTSNNKKGSRASPFSGESGVGFRTIPSWG